MRGPHSLQCFTFEHITTKRHSHGHDYKLETQVAGKTDAHKGTSPLLTCHTCSFLRNSSRTCSAPRARLTPDHHGETMSLNLSKIGFGTWQFGSAGAEDYWGVEFTQNMATEFVKEAVSSGITYFDTAEDYSGGRSEMQLGVALKALSPEDRAKCIVGSKILPNHCSYDDVRKYVDGTLDRLGVDAIDLMMIHWPISKAGMAHFAGDHKNAAGGRDYAAVDVDSISQVPSTELALKALGELQAEGKIKHVGVSNFGKNQLEQAMKFGVKIAVNQVCLNFLFRAVEFEILPFCVANDIQVIAYSPLMQGLCLGRWSRTDDVPIYRARTRHFNSANPGSKSRHGEPGHEKLLFETIDRVRSISEKHGIAMIDLSLAYPLHKVGVSCVVAGATKMVHVGGNAQAGATQLTEEVMKELDEATDALKQAMGGNADLWQGADSRIN